MDLRLAPKPHTEQMFWVVEQHPRLISRAHKLFTPCRVSLRQQFPPGTLGQPARWFGHLGGCDLLNGGLKGEIRKVIDDDFNRLSSVEQFDLSTFTWTSSTTQLLQGRAWHAVTTVPVTMFDCDL